MYALHYKNIFIDSVQKFKTLEFAVDASKNREFSILKSFLKGWVHTKKCRANISIFREEKNVSVCVDFIIYRSIGSLQKIWNGLKNTSGARKRDQTRSFDYYTNWLKIKMTGENQFLWAKCESTLDFFLERNLENTKRWSVSPREWGHSWILNLFKWVDEKSNGLQRSSSSYSQQVFVNILTDSNRRVGYYSIMIINMNSSGRL